MKISLIIIGMFAIFSTYGQTTGSASISLTLPTIALLDLEPNTTAFTLALQAPTEAGAALTNSASNSTKWLNFSSAVTSGLTRSITAQIVSGSLPNGIRLKLVTASYAGSGSGTLGTPTSPVFLSTSAQTIVSGIGGGFTGNGTSNGYNLTFSLEIQTYSQLRSGSSSFSITYTLIDN